MITKQDVMGMLIAACPSYQKRWRTYQAKQYEDEGKPHRLFDDLGDFAAHLVQLAVEGRAEELPAVFEVVERLQAEGDSDARRAARIGLLEAVQSAAHEADLEPKVFTEYLGDETREWWTKLDGFFEGTWLGE